MANVAELLNEKLRARFFASVDTNGPTVSLELGPCWRWTAGIAKLGYGRIRVGRRVDKCVMRVHRLSWWIHYGDPGSLEVRHRCDNPNCARPDHLELGTHAQNMADMAVRGRGTKGRSATVFGARVGSAKLSLSDVTEIRARYAAGETTQVDLAKQFGVRQATISDIIRGRIWGKALGLRSEPVDRSPKIPGTRAARPITVGDRTLTLAGWARFLGVSRPTLVSLRARRGDEALLARLAVLSATAHTEVAA